MREILLKRGIEFFAIIPLKKCKVIKEYLLTKNGFDENDNIIMMLFPYRSKHTPVNISAYASVPDYHAFVKGLSEELEEYMRIKHPHARFKVFADHSPIDEVHAACISGLGFIGDNGLLISEKYSSFVFLGEAVTDLSPEELGMSYSLTDEVKECLHCGRCTNACPCGCISSRDGSDTVSSKAQCLSAITQKKGELSLEEIELMKKHKTVWGCDICQNCCPYTKRADTTPIDYFNNDVIVELSLDALNKMSEEEFLTRPFSWRGRSVVERNLKLFDN